MDEGMKIKSWRIFYYCFSFVWATSRTKYFMGWMGWGNGWWEGFKYYWGLWFIYLFSVSLFLFFDHTDFYFFCLG